jgi:ATP synthase I chain
MTADVKGQSVQTVLTVPLAAAANLRRSAVVGACVGAAALLAASLLGHPLMGVFVLVGLGLGVANTALVQRSVLRFAVSERRDKKRRFTMGVLGRLGAITVVAVACALITRPDGLGAIAGLAFFQLIMLGGATAPLIKELRQS